MGRAGFYRKRTPQSTAFQQLSDATAQYTDCSKKRGSGPAQFQHATATRIPVLLTSFARLGLAGTGEDSHQAKRQQSGQQYPRGSCLSSQYRPGPRQ